MLECDCTYSFAEDIITGFNGSAHLKEIRTGKYILSNTSNLKIFGFSTTDQIIGYSILDLNHLMLPFWGNNFVDEINSLDNTTAFENKVHNVQKWFLHPNKKLGLHDIQKIPIRNKHGNISSILTLSNNIIDSCNYLELYANYKQIYKSKNIAITEFLLHTKLFNSFYCLPTESELIILILKYKYNHNVREISHILKKNIKTVEQHIYNINSIKARDLIEFENLNQSNTQNTIHHYTRLYK